MCWLCRIDSLLCLVGALSFPSLLTDEAVAYGAAVQGAIIKSGGTGGGLALDGISSDLVLLDVTPLSLVSSLRVVLCPY